jgi:hypothetical protein
LTLLWATPLLLQRGYLACLIAKRDSSGKGNMPVPAEEPGRAIWKKNDCLKRGSVRLYL